MKSKNIFNNLKDYNNELEKVLEGKSFSQEVKNLLLSMLYKVEISYADYKKTKVNVPKKEEFLNDIIQNINLNCNKIEIIKNNEMQINKKEKTIKKKIKYIQGINKCDTIIEIEIYGRNHMSKYILEVCVDSVESAISAYNGGATRIELCSNLVIGGTTPDLELFKTIRNHIQIPINVMIRPRYGDFCYTEYEHEIMCRQVENFKNEGADAVVIGSLNIDGTLNEKQMKELIKEAGQCKITLHRAFDMCKDYFQTMEEAIKLGAI